MAILMSYSARSSGAQLLDETSLAYASDAANLGRLTQRVRTHHDGGSSSYATTEAFTYTADPTLAGALRYTHTVTTHDGLVVASNRSLSALTGRLWHQTDARGVNTAYAYDPLGRMISRTIDPGGTYENAMTFDHVITGGTEEAFQIIATDSNGNIRCQGMDGAARALYTAPNSIDDGLPQPDPTKYQTVSRTYDALGRVATATQADWALDTGETYARTGTASYDDWGQAYRTDYDDGTWRGTTQDPIALTATRLIGGTNTLGSMTSGQEVRSYDLSGKLIQVDRYAAGADLLTATAYSTRTMVYDGLHRLRGQTDALKHTTTHDYDNWNRPVHTTLADGTVLTRYYSADSASARVVRISLANSTVQPPLAETNAGTRVFDGLGRVTSATIGGRAWKYQYDAPDAKTSNTLMDARPSQVTAPDGTVRKYTYIPELGDKVSQVQVYQDATLAKLLITQSFTYNNVTGALISAVEDTATKTYTPYSSGRLKRQDVTLNGTPRSMSYDKYTLRGRLRQYTHVDAAVRVTQRNPNGTVSAVSDGAMKVTLGYDAAGRLTSWTASDLSGATKDLTTTLTLDDYGRETGRAIAAAGDDPNNPSWQINQTWNVADQLVSRETKRAGASYRLESYKYDTRNRLAYWNGSGALGYDRYGNRLRTQTFTCDPFNNLTQVASTFLNGSNTATFTCNDKADPCRLVSFTNTNSGYPGAGATVTLTYDNAGRITNDGMGNTLGYDALGRLTTATSTLTGHTGSYTYDAHNRLSTQTVDGQESDFYYKANALVNVIQGSDSRRLLRSPAGSAAQNGPGGVWLSATDAAGSVIAANQGGNTETYGYGAYGEDKPQARSSMLGYTGQYHDQLTPGYQLGNGYRPYLPALMRFTAPDSMSPFGKGGPNAYAYASGDPINYADPSGHFSFNALGDKLLNFVTKGGILSFLPDKYNPVAQFNNLLGKFMHAKWAKYTGIYEVLYGVGMVQNTVIGMVHYTTGLSTSWSTLAVMGGETLATAGLGGALGDFAELGEIAGAGADETEIGDGITNEMGNTTAKTTELPTSKQSPPSPEVRPTFMTDMVKEKTLSSTESLVSSERIESGPVTNSVRLESDGIQRSVYQEDSNELFTYSDRFEGGAEPGSNYREYREEPPDDSQELSRVQELPPEPEEEFEPRPNQLFPDA